MFTLIHQPLTQPLDAQCTALRHKAEQLSYGELRDAVLAFTHALLASNFQRDARLAVYLPKQFETVIALFAATAAGGAMVPINPQLKPRQVAYILNHCEASVLVTSSERWQSLRDTLDADQWPDHLQVILTNGDEHTEGLPQLHHWHEFISAQPENTHLPPRTESDLAAILYTSGSTGQPKGVALSHRNMLAGAESVASYLHCNADDKLLAVLPLSFDYGLNQLTTSFLVGAETVLMDYLLPKDVIKAVTRYDITGLAAVPPLWNQLAELEWPDDCKTLRYLTNSGGAMPPSTTAKLQTQLPQVDIYLMYGLTEAFRSTYLPPDQVTIRPDSMGKAIPNADILVVNEQGKPCAPGEIGELVHCGPLVSQGYWNDPEKTAARFKPAPNRPAALQRQELAVWSGDKVKMDAEGFLYFVGRADEMIKTSGYRVSPTEIEEVALQLPEVQQGVALGVPHSQLGQAIVLIICGSGQTEASLQEKVLSHCRRELPNFMIPQAIEVLAQLPKNPNGKIDRSLLAHENRNRFAKSTS